MKCDICGEYFSLEIAKKYSWIDEGMDPCYCSLWKFIERREKLIKKLRKQLKQTQTQEVMGE